MQIERVHLRSNRDEIYMEAYLLNYSYQANRKRPAVIICPGGGYLITSDREAEPVALRFLAHGYQVFVLRYSVGTILPEPMLDLASAILKIRDHAKHWSVDPDQIAVCGFSAGGHLAAAIGAFWNRPLLYETMKVEPERIKPNALILCYPVINLDLWPRDKSFPSLAGQFNETEVVFSHIFGEPYPSQEQKDAYSVHYHVSKETPPTFIWHTADDEIVSSDHALCLAAALATHHVRYELHIFEKGVHGLSLGDETTDENGRFFNSDTQIWIDLAINWLKRNGKVEVDVKSQVL